MKIFTIFKRNRNVEHQKAAEKDAHRFGQSIPQNINLNDLWHNGTKEQWQEALKAYYYKLKPEQQEIENYINAVDPEAVAKLDAEEFYDFLHDKYFVWKYTAKNRLATTRKNLEKYRENNELFILKDIQNRIFSMPKENIEKCLDTASEIRGLGTAGASGLLAILFPDKFGTVDQFVVRRLQEIDLLVCNHALLDMKPESLKNKDGAILIKILQEKAAELNKKFFTNFWTPRKIDMVLWSFGR